MTAPRKAASERFVGRIHLLLADAVTRWVPGGTSDQMQRCGNSLKPARE